MWQLIKQVLKSFKSSSLLLIGLLFIAFAVIFASFASLYLYGNIENSYNSLENSSKGNQAILQTDNTSLKNSNLSFNYNFDISKPLTPNADGKYFNSLDDLANNTTSFVYQPTNLYHSDMISNSTYKNWLFAYYVSGNYNPYFQSSGINQADSLYKDRAKGILSSYANLIIPNQSNRWRALGLRITDDNLQNIIYAIDPLTGQTAIDSNSNTVDTLGYFSNGYIENKIRFDSGNVIYPNNLTATDPSKVDITSSYQVIANGNKSPLFYTSWDNVNTFNWTNIGYDVQGSSVDQILQNFQVVSGTTNTPDVTNILSSLNSNNAVDLYIGPNINWNFASLSPFYDYFRILHDKRYLTNSDTNNPLVSQKDFVFKINLNMNSLTPLEKDTLNYVRQTYGVQKYLDLTSFIYTVNGSWIKNQLISGVGKDDTALNAATFDTLDSLNTPYGTNNSTGLAIVTNWITNYGNNIVSSYQSQLNDYEQEYLNNAVINQFKDDISYKTQKSFTLSDFKSSSTYIVSRKGAYYDGNDQDYNIDSVVLTQGSGLRSSYQYLGEKYNYLANATKDQDIRNALESAQTIGGANLTPVDDTSGFGYALNPDGQYLVNLVDYLDDAFFQAIVESNDNTSGSALLQQIKSLTSSLKAQFAKGMVNVNDYYDLFAIVTPNVYFQYPTSLSTDINITNLVSFNNQNIQYNYLSKAGLSSTTYLSSCNIISPYGQAANVSMDWFEQNNKKCVSVADWYKAIQMNSQDFYTWKASLSDTYKVFVNSIEFVIIGVGSSYENAYPITSIQSPIPNPKTEGVIYVDDIGYQALLSTNSSAVQDQYYAIRYNEDKDPSQTLNKINSKITNYANNAYSAYDTSAGLNNLLTSRINFPESIMFYIKMFAILLIVVLVIIAFYLCYLLIKIYVEKNQTSLAIARANGLSGFKIVIALSTFGFMISIVAGIIGYVLAYVLQEGFLSIFSNYWFIPISSHIFSIWGFFGSIVWIYLVFLAFTFIGIWITFKNPINDLLTRSADIKVNKLMYAFKSRRIPLYALAKFRVSLAFSKLTRFFLFIILCAAGLSIISVGSSIPRKFDTAQLATKTNNRYSYSYDLQTPSEQSGLYKVSNYSDLGITNEANGIYDVYLHSMNYNDPNTYTAGTINVSPYVVVLQQNPDLLALRNLDGSIQLDANGNKRYYSNFFLPSYYAINDFSKNIDFFRNIVASKWLLNIQITVAGIFVNSWNFVTQSFPNEVISRINALSQNFMANILEVPELKALNDTNSFILKQSNGDYALNPDTTIDLSNVINPNSIRLTDDFLKFVGMVYGDKELSSKDVKIAFGTIPFDDVDNSSQIETYTYLDTTFNTQTHKISKLLNKGKTSLDGINQKIVGIKPNSKFETLTNTNGKDISYLLNDPIEKDLNGNLVYPVVINQGAMYKYDLDVGNVFSTSVKNSYDRFTRKIIQQDPNETVYFKVVGISSDAFDTKIYTSQAYANQILKLNFNQGAAIIGTSNYDFNKQRITTTLLGDPSQLKVDALYTSTTEVVDYTNSNYVPFNGVFSIEQNPLLVNSLILECINGIWGNFTSYDDGNLTSLINNSWVAPTMIMDSVASYSITNFNNLTKFLGTGTSRDGVVNRLVSRYGTTADAIKSWLSSIFGPVNLIGVNGFDYFKTTFDTYTTVFYTLLTIETLLLCIFIPLIIIIVMIISSVMMNDFRRMMAILKTLGFSDKENLLSILATFVPVIIIALLIGIAVLVAMSVLINFLVFNLISIYLSPAVDWLTYLFGVIAIVGVVLINFVFISIYLKKQNLRNSISGQ